MCKRVNVDQLLHDLKKHASQAGFTAEPYGEIGGRPLLGLIRRARPGDKSGPGTGKRFYLSAGIHGDEPAGSYALLHLLSRRAFPEQHDFFICPALNPSGLEAGTRHNADGLDLNRDYTRFHAEETRRHRDWMTARLQGLDHALQLHEDWESAGFYLYELKGTSGQGGSAGILAAVRRHMTIEAANRIDGHPAKDGVIAPRPTREIEEGLPEALYVQRTFGGLNHTFETPSTARLEDRVRAHVAAVEAALAFRRAEDCEHGAG
ncbi:MAG: M14 family metallocarboxypeptidase [Opitutales bacterium]